MRHALALFLLVLFFGFTSCKDSNPLHATKKEERLPTEMTTTTFNFPVEKEVYVPIYSDIYHRTKDYKILLTATLSIRNTSKKDTLFIKNVDYYNSEGDFVHDYIKNPIYLKPLETIDYVIDEEDDTGGSGANFLIHWGSNHKSKPIFQAIMLGGVGSQGITFTAAGETVWEKGEAQLNTQVVRDSISN